MVGKFITFEGAEGSGKSTQANLLCESLSNEGVKVVFTREPGGTKVAELIREILVKGDVDKLNPKTELLLHYAARIDHVEKFIKPNLKDGISVICDRFIDSTVAYQAYGHGLQIDQINSLQNISLGEFIPDLTFVLDISAKNGLNRAFGRGGDENRYERMGLNFHKKVGLGYKDICMENPKRCSLIDATLSINEIHYQILCEAKSIF